MIHYVRIHKINRNTNTGFSWYTHIWVSIKLTNCKHNWITDLRTWSEKLINYNDNCEKYYGNSIQLDKPMTQLILKTSANMHDYPIEIGYSKWIGKASKFFSK